MTEQERTELVAALKVIKGNCEKYNPKECKGCWFKTIYGDCELQSSMLNLPFRNINDESGLRPLGDPSYEKAYMVEKDIVIHKKETLILYGCRDRYVPDSNETVHEFDYQSADYKESETWKFKKTIAELEVKE